MTPKNCKNHDGDVNPVRLDERLKNTHEIVKQILKQFEAYPERMYKVESAVAALQENDKAQNAKLSAIDAHLDKIEKKMIFIDGKKAAWIGIIAVLVYPVVNFIIQRFIDNTFF